MNEIRRGQTTASTGTRIVAMLSLLGGIGSLAVIVFFGAILNTGTTWVGLGSDPVLGVVMLVGGGGTLFVLGAALAGLSLIREKTNPGVASVAALGALGGCIGALWSIVAMFVLPPASAIVAIYLARVDRLPKSIAPAPRRSRSGLHRVGRALGPERLLGAWRSHHPALPNHLDCDWPRAPPWPAVQRVAGVLARLREMSQPSAVEPSADVRARLEEEPGRLARQAETDALGEPASTRIAAGMSLFVGLLLAIMGAAHLDGVLTAATSRGYDYDFRLAGLLLVGSTLVFGGALCLSAVRGLARGRRTAWGRAMSGTLLLLLVLVLMIPLQPKMAPGLSVLAAVNLIALLAARRRLEPA